MKSTRLFKWFGLLALTGRTLAGQESSSVDWYSRGTSELDLNWKTILGGILLAAACGALWKLLMFVLERNRAAVDWKRVRLWWPTAMLVWGWAMLAIVASGADSGVFFVIVLVVFGVLNFPVLTILLILLGFAELTIQPPVWLEILAGSLGLWTGDYLLVRLVEWRAWKNESVSLHLAGASYSDAKDLGL